MKILYITEDNGGVYKVRVGLPAKYLEKRGHKVQILSRKDQVDKIENPDVVVFTRGYPFDISPVVNFFKKKGSKIVYETDDALDLLKPDNPAFYTTPQMMASVRYLLDKADIATTTTEDLANHLKKWNKNAAVLPNCVEIGEWQERKGGDRLRIGWQGGSSHISDLMMVIDVIRDLQKQHDFDFVIQGFTEYKSLDEWYERNIKVSGEMFKNSEIGKALKKLLEKLSKIKYEFRPWVKIDKHPETVRDLNLDIGLCPLVKSDFNRMKSCIKFYEYAMVGTMTMASDVVPYSREVGYLAKNNYWDWKDKLEKLILSEGLRKDILEEQREFVIENRDINKQIIKWEKAYERTAKK